jgi:hydroxymethylbilane synthase
LSLSGLVASPDGSELIRGQQSGSMDDAEPIGNRLASELKAMGAGRILARGEQ